MVFVHGGGFIAGSASGFPEEGIITDLVSKGVILVTINYRLGALGMI